MFCYMCRTRMYGSHSPSQKVEDQKSQFSAIGISRKLGNAVLGNLQDDFGGDDEVCTQEPYCAFFCLVWLRF